MYRRKLTNTYCTRALWLVNCFCVVAVSNLSILSAWEIENRLLDVFGVVVELICTPLRRSSRTIGVYAVCI